MTLPLQLSGKVFAACGLWLVAPGVYFVALRPALLPEDPRFMGSSLEALRAAARSVRIIVHHRGSDGAEHCQMGAQSLRHADLFDWIARINPATAASPVQPVSRQPGDLQWA